MQIDTNIYCRATGKPIAQISDDEFGVILAAYGHLTSDRREALIERLTLGSMRPSLAWMSVTPASLNALREAAPRELLAYLMNRLYAPLDLIAKPGQTLHSDEYLNACRLRIAIWQSIETATLTDAEIDSILFVLLALDTRFGLGKIQKPTAITELWQSWSSTESFIKELWDWHGKLVVEAEATARRAKAQAEFWSNPDRNRLTGNAYFQQFNRVSPPSARNPERVAKDAKKAEKLAKFKEDLDFLDNLEKELTTRGTQPIIPIPQPAKRIMRFGVKQQEA